jgi:hypothetical protein
MHFISICPIWPSAMILTNLLSCMCIFTLLLLSPLGQNLHNLEYPPPKDDLCQVWSKLTQWFWRRSQKCESLQTDGRLTTGDQKSSLELSAKVS